MVVLLVVVGVGRGYGLMGVDCGWYIVFDD